MDQKRAPTPVCESLLRSLGRFLRRERVSPKDARRALKLLERSKEDLPSGMTVIELSKKEVIEATAMMKVEWELRRQPSLRRKSNGRSHIGNACKDLVGVRGLTLSYLASPPRSATSKAVVPATITISTAKRLHNLYGAARRNPIWVARIAGLIRAAEIHKYPSTHRRARNYDF